MKNIPYEEIMVDEGGSQANLGIFFDKKIFLPSKPREKPVIFGFPRG